MRPGEDDLIATLFAPWAGAEGLGLRDDAALLAASPGRDLVVTKDMLVAGVHFFADDPPDAIARKALRVNLSDLAAKGAEPRGFLLGLGLPDAWTPDWLKAFTEGLRDDSLCFQCPLLGGDTVATPGPLTLSVTAFGDVPSGRMVPRGGARAGDLIYVSGTIGDAAIGLRLRLAGERDAGWIARLDAASAAALADRYLLPRPRLGLRRALHLCASAAMDVSDGLVGDLEKMLNLSGVTARIKAAAVPLSAAARVAVALETSLLEVALTGGDDYEILCCVAAGEGRAFEAEAGLAGIAVTHIGDVVGGPEPLAMVDEAGHPLAFRASRFTHFAV